MKTITISDEVLDSLEKLGVEYEEGDTIYEEMKRYYSPFVYMLFLLLGVFAILVAIFHYMTWMGWLECNP